MATPRPRVKVPKTAAAGEVITIKTLISHDMESGQRKDSEGNTIPRKIINKFTCDFNGQTVFSCDIDPAISANPYFEFNAKVAESGTFKFTWVDDDGSVYEAEEKIEVK
ncbi:thiosulfate oxidation carrier complex protein SoxZ [Chelativorans sp. SCAU2101]|jgi:Sulphur oxidation protein SoxZ.|uniref:Thiosulfate oxidation carrier complex protein SoxZ n=1 Tax=Chelativorans petroleitrophicus TaxID=2975484 RepID=A0A9X2X5L3_9HYPH|nr:thiosulfate oxidation carrier complex protein SoxZ [Chelativorans petroleitrophicus]MCT8988918.1 thiosulfate oxidation carrier complex protein SoxZ [Chelativorans petroleitrophicus]PZN48758.1 MAG: thiosulfate oxidation carrier complex protein SoxZ [Pseudomonadota bacterium]